MPKTHTHHRHFIAAPVAMAFMAVVVGASAFLQSSVLGAGVLHVRLSAESEPQQFAIGTAVSGLLQEHSSLLADDHGASVRLVKGQALLRTMSNLTIDLHQAVTVRALVAALYVAADQESFTVAALDAPVMVDDASGTRMVPPGRQWTFRAGKGFIAPLPADWYRERMADLASLPKTEASIVNDDPVFADLALLNNILSSSRMDDAEAENLAQQIATNSVLRKEIAALLPAVAERGTPLKQVFIGAWPDKIVSLGLSDEPLARSLLDDASVLPERMEARGYPLQSQYWCDAVLRASAVLQSVVPADKRAAYRDIIARASSARELLAAAPAEQASVAQAQSTHWFADELSAIARSALVSNGALISSTTTFTADVSTQTIRVDGVFIAEDNRDVPYTFTFDPGRQLILDIVRDGKRQPNAVPVAIFFGSH